MNKAIIIKETANKAKAYEVYPKVLAKASKKGSNTGIISKIRYLITDTSIILF